MPDELDDFFRADRRAAAIRNTLQQRAAPPVVAQSRQIGRALDTPAPIVEGEIDTYTQRAMDASRSQAINDHPWLADWMSNPDNAALGRDDTPALSAVERILRPWANSQERNAYMSRLTGDSRATNNLGETPVRASLGVPALPRDQPFEQIAERARAIPIPPPVTWRLDRGLRGALSMFGEAGLRTIQGAAGLEQFRAEMVGDEFSAALATRVQARVGDWTTAIRPGLMPWQEDIYSGLVSGTQSAAMLPLGLAGMLTAMGGTSGGEAYGRFRERGASIGEAAIGGVGTGAIEAGTELIPMGFLFKNFGRIGAGRLIGGYLLQEQIGEQIATFGQDAIDAAIANPTMTWDRFLTERPAAAMSTAISTLTASLAFGGAAAIAQRLQPEARAVEQIGEAVVGQAMLDNLMEQAQASEVRNLDPDSFSEFIAQRVDGTPVQSVYIPAEALQTYLQSEGAETEFFAQHTEQIAEAIRLGGDVVLPIGEVAAHLAGTQAWEALREDVRLTPGGMSGREARERSSTFLQELETRGAEIAQEAQAADAEMTSVLEVYQDTKNQLLAAGRGSREAEAIAQIVAARSEAAGARMGMSASEYRKANPITFREAEPGETPGEDRRGERTANQAVVNIGLNTNDGTGISAEEAISVLRELGVEVQSSAIGQSDTEPTLIASLSRPLTPEEGHQVSERLRQEAIAQQVGETGDLFGPKAEAWGPFNPDYFLTEEQARAQDVMPTAGWSEQRVSGLMDQFATEDDRTSAWATIMTPDQFLGLTASETGRALIEAETGELSPANLADESHPVYLRIERAEQRSKITGVETYMVMGHDGRHRMTALRNADIGQVPVVLHDMQGRFITRDEIAGALLLPQSSRLGAENAGDQPATVANLIPITWKNRDRLLAMVEQPRVVFQAFKALGIRDIVEEADRTLGGDAGTAIDRFVGVVAGTVDALERGEDVPTFGLMSARELEDAYSDKPSPDGRAIRQQLDAAFAPVREQLKARFGYTITLYRRQNEVEARDPNVIYASRGGDDRRNVMSWTTDPAVADWFAGVGKTKAPFTEEQIAEFEKTFDETGEVKIAGRTLRRGQMEVPIAPDGTINPKTKWKTIDTVEIYSGFEHITDTDSVRGFVEGINEWRNEDIEANERKRAQIISSEVSLDDVIWATDRAGQSEFIVKNSPEGSTFIDETGRKVFQEEARPKSARGQAQFVDGKPGAIVTFFASANLSTAIHELGHVFLEEMFRDASSKGAPQELKEDFAKLKTWFAANGFQIKGKSIPMGAHELFARGFERYAMEGKAPSEGLRGVFAQFQAWLLRIYQVVQNLNAPITPEIRGVFDRMLATGVAIENNQATALPLFKSAEEAGMTDAEFAAYEASIAAARDEAYDALLFRTMEAIRRRENSRMREQIANIRADVAADINSRPEFRALHLLRTGRWLGEPDREPMKVKINTGWLIDNYGDEVLGQLPRGLPITRGDGQDGDTIAEITGMKSGDQLVKTLIAMRAASDRLKASGETRSVRDMLIESEVDRIMADRHGDVMTDGAIEEEAIAAINSARQGEIIAGEMRQLAKRKATLGGPTPYQIARQWAARKVRAGRVLDVASRSAVQRYIRATQKAAKLAEEAILAGDVDEAFRQKQAQLLNHALLAESKKAAEQIETIVARMKRLAGRKAMNSIDQDYFDRVHELLARYDFRQRSQRDIAEADSFEAWAERRRAEGFEVLTPERLADRAEHYTKIDVDTLYDLSDAVESLMHLGRLKQKIIDGREERDFNELRDDIVAHVEQLPDRKLPELVAPDETRAGASAAAALLKVETIADELDGGPNGPMNRLLVQGASRAAIERDRLAEKALVPIARLFQSLGKKHAKSLRDKVTAQHLTWNTMREGDSRLGEPVTMTRMEWIGVALNTGNISNLEKMTKGERWAAPAVQAELRNILTKEDWDLVQAIWDEIAGLWPDIAKAERELSGVVPEQVDPLEIETPFGPYKGGYWPVVYDAARSQRAENNADDEANDLFGFKSGVATPKGHTITRTAAIGPLSYRPEEILVNHIEKVTTRIAYASWARDVIRVIENPKVRGIIDVKLGAEYRRQIKPWLRRQISPNAVDRRGAGWWDKVFRQSRVNLTIAAMGFAYSTGQAQLLGLGYSAGRIGARYVGVGLRRMLNPATGYGKAQDFVFSRSPEMQRRGRELNREVVEVFRTMRGKHGWYTNAQAMAFWHIAMVDRYLVAMPTWLGAHEKAIREGMTDEEASAYADKIVRNSQGSGREKDLSAIQSPNSEAMRFFTMFYTPFNVLFNAQWDAVRGAKKGDWRTSVMITTWFLIATVLADALMSGDWPEGDDDEPVDFADLTQWFGRNVFFGLFGGLPVARDGATYIERNMIGQYADIETPLSGLIEQGVRAADKTYDIAFEDEEVTGAYIKSLSRTIGAAFGLPGGQFGKTAGFLWDTGSGEQAPESIYDWYSGLTSGKTPAAREQQ